MKLLCLLRRINPFGLMVPGNHGPQKQKVLIVRATIKYNRIEPGQTWIDWTNELGGGKRAVWEVGPVLVETEVGRKECKENIRIGDFIAERSFYAQILSTYLFKLVVTAQKAAVSKKEPSWPYNILGVSSLEALS